MYDAAVAQEETKKILPRPSGFRILVRVPKVAEKTDGGVIRPDELVALEEAAATVAFVVDIGPDAYQDQKRFPGDGWCKRGDWVVIQPYTGTRFKVDGKEYRLINDDSVQAVVDDPQDIQRV